MIPKSEWKWFGNNGHFICGRWCRFHLCTQVGTFLVSTVGEYVHPRHSAGSETTEAQYLAANPLGEPLSTFPDMHFETLVFHAGEPCVSKHCDCGIPIPSDYTEIDGIRSKTRGQARDEHMKMCEKWALQ